MNHLIRSFKKGALPLIEITFQIVTPTENGTELLSMIVHSVSSLLEIGFILISSLLSFAKFFLYT